MMSGNDHLSRGRSPMRDLGAVRLSRDDDRSLSVEVQSDAITYTSKARGNRLIHIAKDVDVSGAVSVFEREDLGPWLTEPDKIAKWDNLIVKKLDRLSRNLLDFQMLLIWCDKHGKSIISIDEGFDLSTDWGRLIAKILIMFAEFERQRIGERRRDTAAKMRKNGQWGGGPPPYGYMTKDGGNGLLYQDPVTAPVVQLIVRLIIDGYSFLTIAAMLNADGTPRPRKAPEWRVQSITRIARSRYLRGELQYQGATVRDDDGNPVMLTDEPLVSESEWDQLQQAINLISRPGKGRRETNHFLLRIVYCGECGSPLYHQLTGRNKYYRCPNSHGLPSYRAEELERVITEDLLRRYGDVGLERRVGNVHDYGADLRLAQKELDELEEQYLAHALSAERFARMATRLEARISELTVLAEASKGEQWERTGETVASRWDRLDAPGRQTMLRRLGLTWELSRLYRLSDHAWRWELVSSWLPVKGAHERLSRAA